LKANQAKFCNIHKPAFQKIASILETDLLWHNILII
jgi:hypothetical protein